MAMIDLLSILPIFNLLAPTFKVVRVSRLLKILRIFKIVRYFEPLEIILAVARKQSTILMTVLSLALFYIFITALIMFNAEEDINPETGKYLFENFFDAFYWAACTLTTVGYGDLYDRHCYHRPAFWYYHGRLHGRTEKQEGRRVRKS